MSVPGNGVENLGVVTISSAGEIGGAGDEFHFVFQPMSGDGEIVARVAALVAINPWSQAGVMMRGALTASAPEIFVGSTGGNGWVVQRRDDTTAGSTETTPGPSGKAPGWVRLVREGDRFSAYVSDDGATWGLVRTQTVAMPGTLYVGMAVASHSPATTAGVFMDVAVRSVTGGTGAPTVSILSPSEGTTVGSTEPVTITAAATAQNGALWGVQFFVNGTAVGTSTTPPYSVTLNPLPPGTYNLGAIALDMAGATSNLARVAITVSSGGTPAPPSAAVTIASPTAGATFTAPASITIAANAQGTSIAQVNFYGDGALIGTDATAPYTSTWTNVSAGPHLLTVAAVLSTGLSVSSLPVSVTVAGTGTGTSPPASGDSELPGPWQQQDIGTMPAPGNGVDNLGVVTISSAGAIGGDADTFHYVFQPLVGDGEIVARVAALAVLDPWSQAGVMMRGALTSSAPEVFVGATGGNGWVVQRRDATTLGSTETTPGPSGKAPGWVRLVREGDRFSAYLSDDGATWSLVRSQTVAMPATVYVGLAVASHSTAPTAGVFMNVSARSLTASGGGPTGPTASILSPAQGSVFTSSDSITVNASASDSRQGVKEVVFTVNGIEVGRDSTAPYSVTVPSLGPGSYTLGATATNLAGVSSAMSTVGVIVSPSNTGSGTPSTSVSLTSPGAGSSFLAPAAIPISATAVGGSVARVDFYGDGALIGSDTTAPYSYMWTGVGPGSHTLSAVASFVSSGPVSSQPVSVLVGTVTSTPATLVFTPSDDEAMVEYYTVEIYLTGGALPVASRYLGKPAIVSGEIRVDMSDFVGGLPSGTYVAVVSANGQGGSTFSQPSPAFVK